MKRWGYVVLGVLISVVALYFAFRQMDFNEVWAAVTHIQPGWAVASCVLIGISAFARGVRWSVLLQRRLPLIDACWLWVIGFLFNNILPLKIGEVARSVLAGRRPGMSFTAVLSSVVVERLFDIVAVVILLGISLSVLPLPDWAKQAGLVLGIGAVFGLIVLAVAARNPSWALNFGSKIIGILPRVGSEEARAFVEPFVEGLGGVSNWQTFLGGAGLTIVSWSISITGAWCMMAAFWGGSVPLSHAILSLSGAGLGVSVPSAPSGVGPFQAAIIGLLTAIDYDLSTTQAYAIVIHAATFAVTSVLGLIGLLREGVSFGQIAREAQEIKSHPAEADPAP